QLAGLEDIADVRVGTFSSGMMARLGLAFGLLKESSVYLLDEPTVGISIETVKEIHNYLKEHLSRKLGATILYASHIAREIQTLCDRVAILHKGRLLTIGEPEELIRSLGKPQVIEMEGAECPSNAGDEIRKLDGVELVSLRIDQETGRNFSLRLHTKSARDVLPEIVRLFSRKYSPHIKYINITEPSLEDVYLHLLERGKCLEERKD
ncbi:MAG: ATP-binding cassette domain-containing protein, partial [bacterium]